MASISTIPKPSKARDGNTTTDAFCISSTRSVPRFIPTEMILLSVKLHFSPTIHNFVSGSIFIASMRQYNPFILYVFLRPATKRIRFSSLLTLGLVLYKEASTPGWITVLLKAYFFKRVFLTKLEAQIILVAFF